MNGYLHVNKTNAIALTTTDNIKVGKMAVFTVAEQEILVANVKGHFYALDNICPHEDASLYKGALHGDCVECPLHGSRFNVKTGEPQEEPATEILKTYPLHIENNTLYIQIDEC